MEEYLCCFLGFLETFLYTLSSILCMAERSYGFLLSLIAGITTIFLTILITVIAVKFSGTMLGSLVKDVVFSYFYFFMALHVFLGIVMIFSAYLIKHETHIFLGSSLALFSGIAGLFTVAGLFLGPVLGIIGGILGFREEFR